MYIHIHTHTCICTYSVLSHRSPDANEPPSRPVICSNPYMIQDYEDIEWEEQNRYLQNDPHRVVLQVVHKRMVFCCVQMFACSEQTIV